MSLFSSLMGLFRRRETPSPEPKESPKPQAEPPSSMSFKDDDGQDYTLSVAEKGDDGRPRVPVVHPGEDQQEAYREVARIMFGLVELNESERAEVERRIASADFPFSSEALQRIFDDLKLQDRFKWSEWDYWLKKLGEDTLCEDSHQANMYLSEAVTDDWRYEPIPEKLTKEMLLSGERPISIEKFDAACVACGVEPSKKRRWKSVIAHLETFPEDVQEKVLAECRRAEQERRDKWNASKVTKRGDYWLFKAFGLALSSRARSLYSYAVFHGEPGVKVSFEYSNHTRQQASAWQRDSKCPWQEPYGQKNPFCFFFEKTDFGL